MSNKLQVKCLAAILILAFSTKAQAETPVIEWTRQLGTASDDYGIGVSVDSSGNVYFTGHTRGGLDGHSSTGGNDIYLAKYDTFGDKLWTRQLGTSYHDFGADVSVDSSGNAYVTGNTRGNLDGNTNAGGIDMFLTKYNTSGVRLWTRQLGTVNDDLGTGVSVDSSGNAYVTGYTRGGLDGNTNAGLADTFLIKYDTSGSKQWTRQLGTTSYDDGTGVSVDSSGNAYVTGLTDGSLDGNSSAGDLDMFITKYNTAGFKQWTRQLGTANDDNGSGVSVDSSGNAYVTGYTMGGLDGNTNAGAYDMFLTKYNTAGVKLWTRQHGTVNGDSSEGVSVDSSGNAYVTGYTMGGLDGNTNAGSGDIFITKYDTDGVKLWTGQLGTTSWEIGYDVSVDSSGNAYITGRTDGGLDGNTNAGGPDMFLVKISSIPEPGGIAMLAAIALTSLMYRKRKHV